MTKEYWVPLNTCVCCKSTFGDHAAHIKKCKPLKERLKMDKEEFKKWAMRKDISREQVEETYQLYDKMALNHKRNGLTLQADHCAGIAKVLKDAMLSKDL